jgi:thiol-disulfide isomerase/thioredoxin
MIIQTQAIVYCRRIFLLALAMSLANLGSVAQTKKITRVNIGDKVPDITIPTIINYSKTSAKISDFKGKLLILDFWSIWCGGCIDGLPHLEALQKKYSGKIVILPVAFTRSKAEVIAFFQKMQKNDRTIHLPSAVYPTMKNDMMTMFPCYGFPMEIWIDENGKLLSISDSFYVTEENINKVLAHEDIQIPLPDTYIKLKTSIVKKISSADKSETFFNSRISGYSNTDLLVSQRLLVRKKDDKHTSLTMLNASVVELFRAVYGRRVTNNDNWVSVEIPDSLRLFYPVLNTNFNENRKNYTYCYQINLPSYVSYDDALSLMNKELSIYFNIQSSIEKRATQCYILKQITPTFVLNTQSDTLKTAYDKGTESAKLTNTPIKYLVLFLQSGLHSKKTPIVVDETGYTKNIDIDIQLPKEKSLESLNEVLRKYNLVLELGIRDVEKMILKKKSNST